MTIYEDFSFEGKYLCEVSKGWCISERCIYNLDSKYKNGLVSFELNSYLKRAASKRKKIKNKINK